MGIELVTDATDEPISLELAWAHLSIDAEGSPPESAFDLWLEQVGIPAARASCEDFLGVSLAPKTYCLTLDGFPAGAIEMRWPPVTSIDSVVYVDTDHTEQTMDVSEYTLDSSLVVPWLIPADGWPSTASVANAVRITFKSGYDAATVPPQIKAAMLLMLGHLFKNREAITDKQTFEMPFGIENLLRPRRVKLGMA